MKRFLKILGTVLTFILGGWLVILFWPTEKRPERKFYRADDPEILNIAHRGGRGLAPEGTMTAFDNAVKLGVDMFEFDTHITKDGHLVVIHDDTVDRTTNGVGKVNDLTLAEIQELDAGYYFTDEKGDYSFRNQGIYIPTVKEVFVKYPNMRHLIEMKDTNRPEVYEDVIQELWRLIQEYHMEDNIMVGSFNHRINERFEQVSWGTIPVGAGEDKATQFVKKHLVYLNGLAGSDVDSLQLPTADSGMKLTFSNLIKSAQRRNMSVYYWTVNEEAEMRELIEKRVDGIITDYPDRLAKVLVEYQ